MFSLLWFVLVLISSIIFSVNGQSTCHTPSGAVGECISIYDCQQLMDLVQKPYRSDAEVQFLQQSKCGYNGTIVMVCCPAECATPEGLPGKCVSIHTCDHLKNMLRPPVSKRNREYVQNSMCNGPAKYSVCCGRTPTTTTATTSSTPVTPLDINAKCKDQQTAFPPDPSSNCCGYESKIINKIIGGNATTIDQYPWLALIEYDRITPGNPLLCGGALISGRYVLTAAHCIGTYAINTVGRPKLVRLSEYDTSHEGEDCVEVEAGGNDCTYGDVKIDIETLIPHPEYTALGRRNDIGLIRLAKMAPFTDFIRPICLPTYDITLNPPPPENFTLYAAGWGATEESKSSSVKLHIGLPFVDQQTCQVAYSGPVIKANLWNRQLCAGGQPGKDSCKGDSGGPLMYENGRIFELIGVVNFGPKPCAQANIPGVYAKVYSYRDWILRTITK